VRWKVSWSASSEDARRDGAQVHLVMHENDGFAAPDRPTEASVVLKLKGEADPEIVKGIAHLVASSVDGLTSDHVTIVDDTGRMLSEAVKPCSATKLDEPSARGAAQIENTPARKPKRSSHRWLVRVTSASRCRRP